MKLNAVVGKAMICSRDGGLGSASIVLNSETL